MSGDKNQPQRASTPEVQAQLKELFKDVKDMAASIATLVRAITPKNNAATQSGSDRISDPQTVPENSTNPRRVYDIESARVGKGYADHEVDGSSTYPIQNSTSAFLELSFGLKKPVDNKIRKAWEAKFHTHKCDMTNSRNWTR